MEVTVIGRSPKTGTSPGTKTQQSTGTDFNTVIGKALNSGEDAKTPQKAQKEQDSESSGTKPERDSGKERQKSDKTDGTGVSQSDAAQVLTGVGQTAAQALTEAAAPADGMPSAGSGTPAPAADSAAVSVQTSAQPAAILTPEAFTANVKAELKQSAQNFQAQLQQATQGTQAASTEYPVQTAPQAAPAEQSAQTVSQAVSEGQPVSSGEPIISTVQPEQIERTTQAKPASAGGRLETQKVQDDLSTPSGLTAQESIQPNAVGARVETPSDTASQGGMGDSDGKTEPELAGAKKSDGAKEAAPPLSQAVFPTAAQAQIRETADLQEAVNRALVQFDRDFQGIKGDAKNLQISLHPKELGSVFISLAAGAGGVTAKIQTSSAEVASLLSAQVQRMIASMEDKGVRVQNVEVVLTQTPQQDGGNGGEDTQQQYREPSSSHMHTAVRSTVERAAAADYERMTENCVTPMEDGQRVEYRV